MSIGLLTAILFGSIFAGFVTGLPIAFVLGGVSMALAVLLWGAKSLSIVAHASWGSMSSFILIAIPLFILMGNVLERSGVADALYRAISRWMGHVNGGLAIATVVICTFMAAMVGVVAAGVVTMAIIALPAMSKHKYNKSIAMGSVMAGGGLGTLIPPSVSMILFCLLARESVGKMFAGGMIPGLILSTLYMSYIGLRCARKPELGPALPPEERASWVEKFAATKDAILPILLIVAVLGSIFTGAATPTEASAVGVVGAIISAAIYRRFSWAMLKEAAYRTARLFGLIMWILIGASCFTRFYIGMGAAHLIEDLIMSMAVNPWVILIGIQISLIILGMVMEDYAIIMIATPIYLPIVIHLGFDPLWFGVLFMVNMQIAILTPPYGFTLFYMKGAVPDVKMADLYRAIIPFTGLQVIGLALVMGFPQLALWLPGLIFR